MTKRDASDYVEALQGFSDLFGSGFIGSGFIGNKMAGFTGGGDVETIPVVCSGCRAVKMVIEPQIKAGLIRCACGGIMMPKMTK